MVSSDLSCSLAIYYLVMYKLIFNPTQFYFNLNDYIFFILRDLFRYFSIYLSLKKINFCPLIMFLFCYIYKLIYFIICFQHYNTWSAGLVSACFFHTCLCQSASLCFYCEHICKSWYFLFCCSGLIFYFK